MILDASQLADAQILFKNTCAACHREDGGGAVGPNLTDDYWLHGGTLKDVFKSVKYGWKDKGMPEWQHNMSAKQIAGITSYVKSLKGKNPAGAKAPQGDLLVEGGDKAIDSVSNSTEPTLEPTAQKENKNNPLAPFKKERRQKGILPKNG
jgi:cytochrome c oxidase cbb3-type subunit 3